MLVVCVTPCSAAVPSFAQTAKAGVAEQARGPSREDGASRQAQGASPEEQFLFDAANRERAARQLPALRWDAALAEAARQHAQVMAAQHRFAHQLPGELTLSQRAGQAGARFSRVAENIAAGPELEDIHVGWMDSPGHRANILDGGFTALGVGVVESKGKLYAVEDFSVAVDRLGLQAQEEKVAALLGARGVRVVREKEMARELCVDRSAGPPKGPMLILRYESSDLNELPEMVTKKIREYRFGQAAVGACTPKEDGTGFTRFRIAVVLF
jgi:uncharacterized protein YkwD